jgi:hypothetical protein
MFIRNCAVCLQEVYTFHFEFEHYCAVCWQEAYTFQFEFEQYVFDTVQYVGKKYNTFQFEFEQYVYSTYYT